jgi:hypothetical protein
MKKVKRLKKSESLETIGEIQNITNSESTQYLDKFQPITHDELHQRVEPEEYFSSSITCTTTRSPLDWELFHKVTYKKASEQMIEEKIRELFTQFGTPSRLVTLHTGAEGMEIFREAMKEKAEKDFLEFLK